MVEVLTIETSGLGDRSYLVHDGTVAVVVDPQRDLDRVLALAEQHRVRITHVLETHIHNDYVTGGLALAGLTGAGYYVNADDPVSYDRVPVRDGDVIDVSPSIQLRALATPGHTYTHLSYALAEVDGGSARALGVFTGGSMLYGSTGRPDLLGPDHTDALARAQHASARRLATTLPDEASVFPTHGFGSFCSVTQTEGADSSTIADEKRTNPALLQDEAAFVAETLAGLDAYPAYYAHMGPANLAGPAAADLTPATQADPAELARRLDAGEWVVDLRSRTAFAAGHLPGTLNFELDTSFVNYLGWLIPWGTPLTLLGDTPEQVADAQRELVRIGIDRPAAAASGKPEDWSAGAPLGTLGQGTFDDLAAAARERPIVILDVRRNLEWRDSHVVGSVHIPLHELLDRVEEVPAGEVWVHCASGYRSAIAASVLARAGRTEVVAVDADYDPDADRSGLPLARGTA